MELGPSPIFAKTHIISSSTNILSTPIGYLKGVGPQRAELLQKELSIFSFEDLLNYFPYRHVDKTKVDTISGIGPSTDYIQVAAVLMSYEIVGAKGGRRLVAQVKDQTGTLELAWFQGISWIQKTLQEGQRYLIYGRVGFFQWESTDRSSGNGSAGGRSQ